MEREEELTVKSVARRVGHLQKHRRSRRQDRRVIATPDVSRVLLERGADRSGGVMACRIVIASDGLWDAATPKMVSAETRKMNCQNAAAALVKLSQKAKF